MEQLIYEGYYGFIDALTENDVLTLPYVECPGVKETGLFSLVDDSLNGVPCKRLIIRLDESSSGNEK